MVFRSALFYVLPSVWAQDLFLGHHDARSNAGTWQRVLMEDAVVDGAVCIDGSPGAYYLRKGSSSKWLIFNEGGGWCTDTESCYKRSTQDLGSSKGYPDEGTCYHCEGMALFDTAPFDDFTVVYSKYCDGGSMTGDATDSFNGTTLYYRGRRLLDALIGNLISRGIDRASEVLYAGCSAGGMTTYAHADYVRSRLPSSVQFLGLAEAMFSLEHNSAAGVPTFQNRMKWVYSSMNSSASMNDLCVQAMGEANGWRCLFGSNVAPYVQTPMFVLNSKYDTWQKQAILGVDCSPPACDAATEKLWVGYGHLMVEKLNALPARHGAFVSNCPAHCQLGSTSMWTKTTISVGKARTESMRDAFVRWYNAGGAITGRWVHACDERPCGSDTCGR